MDEIFHENRGFCKSSSKEMHLYCTKYKINGNFFQKKRFIGVGQKLTKIWSDVHRLREKRRTRSIDNFI